MPIKSLLILCLFLFSCAPSSSETSPPDTNTDSNTTETGGSGGQIVVGGGGSAGQNPVGGQGGFGGIEPQGGSGGEAGTQGNAGSGGVPAPFCPLDTTRCNGLDKETCSGDTWEYTETCTFLCQDGICQGVCDPNAKQCDGLVPQICDGQGQWDDGIACPFVCSAGNCLGVCTPTAKQCNWGNSQVCTAQGQWQSTEVCPFACWNGDCVGNCVPTDFGCVGATPRTCNAQGQWVNDAACPFACSLGACVGNCVPNDLECVGDTLRTCNALGSWVDTENCTFVCLNGACSGVCTPGDIECVGTSTKTCNATGQWDNLVACPTAPNATTSCTDGVCGWSCQTGYDDCNLQASDGCENTLATDSLHCGTCDRTCYGAECSASKCQPQIVAITVNAPADIAVSEDFAYWSTYYYNMSVVKPDVFRATMDNIVTTLHVGEQQSEIAIDENRFFISYGGYGGSNLRGYGFSGTPVWQSIQSQNVVGLAADGTNVYTGNFSDHSIQVQPVDSGQPGYTLYTETELYANGPFDVIVHSGRVFWVGTGRVRSISTSGGAPTLIDYDMQVFYHTLAADDTHVYWGTQKSGLKANLYKASYAGGDKVSLAQSQINGSTLYGIAVDDTYVYYTELGLECYVRRVLKDGSGVPETLATGCNFTRRIDVNSKFIYWLGHYSIMRLLKQ
jgi:hypothetical protein